MASFTDQISNFNPYVQQLPVEAMAKVGMQKQAQYDAGVQKIQGYIDNIAGIDIYKDEHKQYLQTKLNELGSKLKTVAAGDFSNQQLVNSVGGMATTIVKDPIIQIARASTEEIRKNQQRLESDISNGKVANQNEWDWNNQLAAYNANTDIKASFRGRYKQFKDVDKKLRDVADKIHEVDSSIEIPYQRDANGQVQYDKNGKPVIDQAMLSIKTKGKPAEKILSAFMNSLDESDVDQLGINGRYHYRNANFDTFKNDIVQTYETKQKFVSDEIVNTSVKLDDPKLNDKEKALLRARYNDLLSMRSTGKFEKEMKDQLAELGNPKDIDAFKAKLYTQKYLTGVAKDMSWQSYEQEYKSNPYFQASMQMKTLQATYDQMRQSDRHFNMTYAQTERKMAQDLAAKVGNQPIVTPDPLDPNVELPSLMGLNQKILEDKAALTTLNANYASRIFTSAEDKKLTPAEKLAKLDKLTENYKTDPSMRIEDNNLREYLEKRRGFEMVIAQKNNLYASVKNQTAAYDKDVDAVLSKYKGVTFADGRTMFTPRQLFEVAQDYTASMKVVKSGIGSVTKDIVQFSEKDFLKKYEGTPQYAIAKAFVKNSSQMTPTEKAIFNQAQAVSIAAKPAVHKVYNEQLTKQGQLIAKMSPEFQTASGTLSQDNKVDMDRTSQLISGAINTYNQFGALDVTGKSEFDPEIVNKWRQNPKIASTLDYIVKKKYDGSAELVIQNGTEKQVIPMDAGKFSAYYPQYAKTNPMNTIKSMVLSSPGHTTNATGTKDATGAVNAYYSGFNVPLLAETPLASLVRLDVEGAEDNDGGPNDRYQLRMYVNDNGIWKDKILNTKGFVNESGVQDIMRNIGTRTVEDILKK